MTPMEFDALESFLQFAYENGNDWAIDLGSDEEIVDGDENRANEIIWALEEIWAGAEYGIKALRELRQALVA